MKVVPSISGSSAAVQPSVESAATKSAPAPIHIAKKLPTDGLLAVVKPLMKSNAPSAKAPPVAKGRSRHTVRKGETLSFIAHLYHVTTKRLQHWNHITNPNRVIAGEALQIPPAR